MITIFNKEVNGGFFNRLEVCINFPKIGKWARDAAFDIDPKMVKHFGIDAPTTFLFIKSDWFWEFHFNILGFGFTILRQFSY